VLIRSIAAVLATVALMGCSASPKEPGSATCPIETLPTGVSVSYASGGGFAGNTQSFKAFEDGRVEVQTNKDRNPRVATIAAGRVSQLVKDLEATKVKDEDEGCYQPDEPEVESFGSTLSFKDTSRSHQWSNSSSVDSPEALTKALEVASTFFKEVDPQAK
jgi:hypothetical protein